MTRILLIRHATADQLGRVLYGRTPGVHLNSLGLWQARALAEELKRRYKINSVISSPLERALETAQMIADAQNLKVAIEEAFNELDFGRWVGKSFSELDDLPEWRQYNRFRSLARAPEGESLMEAQARAWARLDTLRKRFDNAVVAIVSHGDIVKALLLLLLGMPLDYVARFEVEPASVSELMLGDGEPVVQRINQVVWTRGGAA